MGSGKPLISVVVPVYNAAPYLERCLASIQAQTWLNMEIILVDDGSQDGSGELCDAFARQDKRVRALHFSDNRGPSAARNGGVRKAEGAFVSFVDADDHIEPKLLERLYDNLMEKKADVSVCGADGIRIVGGPAGVFSGREARGVLARSVPFNHVPWGKLYTMEVLRKCPFDEAVFYSEDLLFLYRLFGECKRVSYLPEALYHYGDREGSQVHSGVSGRKMTALLVHDIVCRDAAMDCPEALDDFQRLALDTNLRLAIQGVKINAKGTGGYLKQLKENTRRYFSRRALAGFSQKKDIAGVLFLYMSATLFWGVLALWYHGVKPLIRPSAGRQAAIRDMAASGEGQPSQRAIPTQEGKTLTEGTPHTGEATLTEKAPPGEGREDEQGKPLISVVVPVYNVEPYLEKCLDSIRVQTWRNLEIILVDDASGDGSGRICDAYAVRDKRITAVHFPVNRGLSAARNEGVRRAVGEYLTFVDSDDYVEPELVECLWISLIRSGGEISICGVDGFSAGNLPAGVLSRRKIVECMARRSPFLWNAWGKLFPTGIVKEHPFDERALCCEDLVFFYEILGHTRQAGYVPEPLYHYVYRQRSLINSGVDEKRCTVLSALDEICRDSAERFPEMACGFEQIALDTGARLAMEAVKSGMDQGELGRYLKRFRDHARAYFNLKALRLCPGIKSMAAQVILCAGQRAFLCLARIYGIVKVRRG